MIDPILVAHSVMGAPGGRCLWMIYVADQLVEAAGDDWSPPVQFKFERQADGRLEMWLRNVEESP